MFWHILCKWNILGYFSIFAIKPHAHNGHMSNQKKKLQGIYWMAWRFLPFPPPPPKKDKTKKTMEKTPQHINKTAKIILITWANSFINYYRGWQIVWIPLPTPACPVHLKAGLMWAFKKFKSKNE